MITPLIKNLNSSSLARISFYNIKSNQLLMEGILTLIFLNYRLSKTNAPQKRQTPQRRVLNLLGEFFLPQLPASRFNIQGFRLSNGA
ncbi:hypothetical protein EPC75_00990 [Helicobacter pylori]|nr:hypothetical protein EPC73_07270 [Helicobacter pylori]KAA6505252.1 hypothetical protein EPC78_00635 [Helicobacter pylori]KAA6518375.1 hypothetical protein EPC75_00990 [Helicobacter pylori]